MKVMKISSDENLARAAYIKAHRLTQDALVPILMGVALAFERSLAADSEADDAKNGVYTAARDALIAGATIEDLDDANPRASEKDATGKKRSPNAIKWHKGTNLLRRAIKSGTSLVGCTAANADNADNAGIAAYAKSRAELEHDVKAAEGKPGKVHAPVVAPAAFVAAGAGPDITAPVSAEEKQAILQAAFAILSADSVARAQFAAEFAALAKMYAADAAAIASEESEQAVA